MSGGTGVDEGGNHGVADVANFKVQLHSSND